MITRRGFVRGLLGASALIVTPEPVKKYFFAPQGGWKLDPNSGLYGLAYWQVPARNGSRAGIQRLAYPGRLRLPLRGGNPLGSARIYSVEWALKQQLEKHLRELL